MPLRPRPASLRRSRSGRCGAALSIVTATVTGLALAAAPTTGAIGSPALSAVDDTAPHWWLDPTFVNETDTGAEDDGLHRTTGPGVATVRWPRADVYTPTHSNARATALTADGKIIVAGDRSGAGIEDCRGYDTGFALARLRSYGSLDPTFGTDGKTTSLIAGDPEFPCGNATYTSVVESRAVTVEVGTDGKIYAAGNALGASNQHSAVIARYTPDGVLDTSFGTGGWLSVRSGIDGVYQEHNTGFLASHVHTDGTLTFAGISLGYDPDGNDAAYTIVTRLRPGGGLDPSFGDHGVVRLPLDRAAVDGGNSLDAHFGVTVTPAGTTLVTLPSRGTMQVHALSATGATETGFGSRGTVTIDPGGDVVGHAAALDVAARPDGKVYVVGRTNAHDAGGWYHSDFAIARLTPTGAMDTTFGGDGLVTLDSGNTSYDDAQAVSVDGAGRAVITGSTVYDSVRWGFTRLLDDGTVDHAFTGGVPILQVSLGSANPVLVGRGSRIDSQGRLVAVGTTITPDANTNAVSTMTVLRLRAPSSTPEQDNGSVFFHRQMEDSNTSVDVFQTDPRFGSITNITRTPSAGDSWHAEAHPVASPDGTRVAYFYAGKADATDSGLYTMTSDGGDKIRLADFDTTGIVYAIAWSPDGKTLVYHSSRDGQNHLRAVSVAGARHRTLTTGAAFDGLRVDGYPAFSPDGRRLLFTARPASGVEPQLYSIPLDSTDGTGLVALTDHPRGASNAAYAADGTQVIFQANRDNDPDCPGCNDLYTAPISPDGLTVGTATKVVDTGDNDIDGSFSPDGSRILYVRHVASGPSTVYTADPDGTDPRPLGEGQDPSWAPRSQYFDTDGIPDQYDNCLQVDNPDQADQDGDGTGDACEEPAEDLTAPRITDRSPRPDSRGVDPSATVSVTFSEELDPGSVTRTSVQLRSGSTVVPADVRLSADWTRVILDPADELEPGRDYTVTVHGGSAASAVRDLAGNAAAGASWSFTVNSAPTITALTPRPGSATKDRTPTIKATVKDAESRLKASNLQVSVDGKQVPFTYKARELRLAPKLRRGKHTVLVVATDPASATTQQSWRFKVR